MLLIDINETFSVTLIYTKGKDGELKILDKEPEATKTPDVPGETVSGETSKSEECMRETFEFRKPAWGDVRVILNRSTIGGNLNDIDPLAFMESKIRILLKSWSLKDHKGKTVPFDHLEKFPPPVVVYLNNEIDKVLGAEGLFGMSLPRI